MNEMNRRNFLKFLGVSSVGLTQIGTVTSLVSCSSTQMKNSGKLLPTRQDDLVLAEGLNYQTLISWGDVINSKEVFGFNNDYIAIEPLSPNELLMWVNHEYVNPIFVSSKARTKKNVDIERELVGGSIIQVNKEDGQWKFQANSRYNKGVRGTTVIPFNNGVKVRGSSTAEGTLGNCAGGKTPWGTFLTCEENYQDNYGERNLTTGEVSPSYFGWEKFYNNPPEHYGWVVEIDPKTAKAKKHTNLGRMAHECATCTTGKTGNVVVYTGDDKNDEHLYKFISNASDNFDKGTLYVANIEKGQWISLNLEDSTILKRHFKTQVDVHTYARKAAKLVGATKLDRPEDIEIHPKTGDVYMTLTNNKPKGNYHGSILKISENNNDHNSLNFKSETFVMGGEQSGLSCPDNLAFDPNGNLWVANDISGSSIGKGTYKPYGNNGLFVVPTSGAQAGQVIQIASAPVDAELTGLCFSPDYKSLFLSVQHPGEKTKDLNNPTSVWPAGKTPKPSVVVIEGPLLESLTLS